MVTCRTVARLLVMCAVALPGAGPASAENRNFYEWSSVAPDIVVARVLGEEGRLPIAVAENVLKGGLQPGDEFLIDIRSANKVRMSHRAKLRLLHGSRYLLLMERNTAARRKWPLYDLVRGVDGARDLPPEGEEALLNAVKTFISLHGIEDHDRLWERHSDLLESMNPVVLRTVLEQYVKFRRGLPHLIPAILPLMAHPSPDIRSRAVSLIGQIYEDGLAVPDQDDAAIEGELMALARRDGSTAVRIAATIAVSRLPGEEPVRVLQRIARDDPDQVVRYTAQKLLLEEKERAALSD